MSSSRYLFAAAALAAVGFSLLALGQRAIDRGRFQEERAVAVAKAAAWVSVQEYLSEEDDAEGLTQRFALAAQQKVAGLQELLVLRNVKFLAHTDKERAGERLDRESLADKALYDASGRLKSVVKKNLEEKERRPELVGYAYPEAEIDEGAGRLTVRVPAKLDDKLRNLVQVTVAEPVSVIPFPWLVVLLALAVSIVFVPVGLKLPRGVQWGVGPALLVGLCVAQAMVLVDWRDDSRRAQAQALAETYDHLAQAGLLAAAADEDEAATLLPWLAITTRGVEEKALIGLVKQGADAPAGVRHEGSAAIVSYRAAWFEEQRSDDASDVTLWTLAFALLALCVFALGTLGHLTRARRAAVQHKTAYAYLSPAMLGMGVLVFVPVAFGIVLGFMQRQYNVFEFAGLANYVAILSDFAITEPTNFYFKLGVTVMWTVLNVGLHVSIGLAMALLLNDEMLKARGIYRVLLIVPWAIPNYITALIWRGMFHKQFGAVNGFLEMMGIEPVGWFQSFWPAFTTNLVTNTWLGFPFMMVVSLGALQSIPSDLYEAATVDGAGRWQRFRHITLPLLMPALVPAVIVGSVWTFNMFNIIYLVSAGAPNGATDILITDAFRWAFERDRYGYAAAYSTVIFLILFVFTTITNRITGATEGAFE